MLLEKEQEENGGQVARPWCSPECLNGHFIRLHLFFRGRHVLSGFHQDAARGADVRCTLWRWALSGGDIRSLCVWDGWTRRFQAANLDKSSALASDTLCFVFRFFFFVFLWKLFGLWKWIVDLTKLLKSIYFQIRIFWKLVWIFLIRNYFEFKKKINPNF